MGETDFALYTTSVAAAAAAPLPPKLRLPARLTAAVNADRRPRGIVTGRGFPRRGRQKDLFPRARSVLAWHCGFPQTHNDPVRAKLTGMNVKLSVSRGVGGTLPRRARPTPLTQEYLNFAWEVGKNYSPKEGRSLRGAMYWSCGS